MSPAVHVDGSACKPTVPIVSTVWGARSLSAEDWVTCCMNRLVRFACVALLAVGSTVTWVPPGAVAGAADELGVTIVLKPSDPAGLEALAKMNGVLPSWRRAELARVGPSPATVSAATRELRTLGLSVSQVTNFTIHATGSRSVVESVFGSTRSARGVAGMVALKAPGPLAGLVSAVVGGDDRRVHMRPTATLTATPTNQVDGPRVRRLYRTPFGQPASGTAVPTIATLQLSGFNASDLSHFAAESGLPNPVATGQFKAYSVDGASVTRADGTGGDEEVALDQEALLAAAPFANQHAYFTRNDVPTGFTDAIAAIENDAATGSNDGFSLSALSMSWGACELAMSGDEIVATDQALLFLTAAGVTSFAAAGDSGAYACSTPDAPDNRLAVTYPASDPLVIGVGGTSVAPDDSQSAWWIANPDANAPFRGFGGGGGYSAGWQRPQYQDGVNSGEMRAVPDMALAADPASGFRIAFGQGHDVVGGTSVSSPFAAATFVDMLIQRGISSGIGFILPNLYAAPSSAFTDITSGSNGHDSAHAGFDLASGLGAPRWDALTAAITGAPILTAPATSASRTIPITVTVPQGMQYDGWSAGVGVPPADCNTTSTPATDRPTSVTATADGDVHIWVVGYTPFGPCYVAQAHTFVGVAPTPTPTPTPTPSPSPTDSRPAAPALAQSSTGGLVYLNVRVDPRFEGRSVVYYVRSGTSGKVRPLGSSSVTSRGFTFRYLNLKRGQILAVYSKLQGTWPVEITDPYSNTVTFKVG